MAQTKRVEPHPAPRRSFGGGVAVRGGTNVARRGGGRYSGPSRPAPRPSTVGAQRTEPSFYPFQVFVY